MRTNTPMPQAQQGTTLAFSLIMLLLLTVIGLTAMRSATLEEKMAANAQNITIAFQASESAVAGAVANTANLTSALVTPQTITSTIGSAATNTAIITYRQSTPATGHSAKIGSGMQALHFDVTATGRHTGANAKSQTAEGIYQVAPGASSF